MKSSIAQRVTILGATGALAIATLALAPSAVAASVEPALVPGNPTCSDLGYAHGTKWDYPDKPAGTYQLGNGTVTWSTTGKNIDWSATIGVDAVIVKGGPQANVYHYAPPATSDTGLITPDNASGGPAGLSHVEFCYHYNLAAEATAELSYTRTHNWTVDKSGDQSELTLPAGQSATVDYAVTVDQTHTDSDFAVAGTITVSNPDPTWPATVTGVVSSIEGLGNHAVDCGVAFPYVLAPSGVLQCTFNVALPDGAARMHSYEVTATGKVGGMSGSRSLVFGDPTTVVDGCAEVSDDKVGPLGTVCAAQTPKTFTYQLTVGPYADCGTYQFANTASLVTSDTQTTGSDTWNVAVDVPCVAGCTLTPGYWKTHSSLGPAPFDPAWNLLPGGAGANTAFFTSGQTYYQVLWTPPAGGNAYYILAHAYIATEMNGVNGANTSSVQGTMSAAKAFFETHGPKTTLSKADRAQAISWASILDDYNNGLTGPGHCTD